MNKTFLFFSFLLMLALTSCKDEPKVTDPNLPANFTPGESANPTVLAGYWINLDFCSRAGQYGSVIQTVNNSHLPYAYAFAFNPGKPDSVTCFNASSAWTLPVKYKKDTLEIVGAIEGKRPVYLVYHSHGEKDMTMFDNSSGSTRMDNFIKSKAGTKDGYTAFTTALGHHLFSGQFTPTGKNASKEKIVFTPGGFITGWKVFDRYVVCTGGDCLVAGQEIDVFSLYNSKQGEAAAKYYGYKYNAGNDELTIYNLISSGEKGSWKAGAPAYTLKRSFSVPAPNPKTQQPAKK